MNYLIIDDHPIILDLIENLILNNGNVIYKALNEEEAFKILYENEIHRVICDLNIGNGKNLIIPNYLFVNHIPYMVFSSFVNISLINVLEELNCKIYVSKGSSTESLIEGLKILEENDHYYCNNVINERKKHINSIERPILSKAEIPIIDGFYNGLTVAEISQKINLSTATIRNHRARAIERNDCNFNDLLRRFGFWEK